MLLGSNIAYLFLIQRTDKMEHQRYNICNDYCILTPSCTGKNHKPALYGYNII